LLNADLAENSAFATTFDLAGINIVNVTASDRGTTAADTDGLGDEGYTINLAGGTATNSASIKTVNILGTQALSYTVAAETTALETVDASGTTATAAGLGGIVTIDATAFAGLQGLVIKGGAGRDVLTGSLLDDAITGGAGNDTINGLVGNDVLTGGAGTDTFQLTAAASFTGGAPSATVWEEITDYALGVDRIDETVADLALSTDASQTFAVAGTAAISLTTGIATFNAADDTLAERIAAVNAGLAAGTEATNQFAIFEFSGSTYVYIYDNTADTVAAEDGLVKLTGVTGVTAIDLTTSTGNLILS
jgi:Ca2+-binding RTX toxin-like protein